MTKEEILASDDYTVTLTIDDDSEIECQVITIYEACGHDYIALLPLTGEEAETGNVFLYRFSIEDGEPVLENIFTDEEYDIASDGWDEYLDTIEFDELVTEDDKEEE